MSHYTRQVLTNCLWEAASFRESKASDERPDDWKNQDYADNLNGVLTYVKSLPDDDPLLKELDECGFLVDWASDMPKDQWDNLIHCNASDPAAWFAQWARGLLEEHKGGEWGKGAICNRCKLSFNPEWTNEDLPCLPGEQIDNEIVINTHTQLDVFHADNLCPKCFMEAYRVEARGETMMWWW